MPITIGANIFSLKAQRAQANATDALSQTFQRLSSGLRINSAADDAAGLAVASKLQTETRLYTTAQRNIGDGVSALQIISSSLQSQLSITQRLQELAEQAASGTLSSTQRGSLNREYQSLLREYGRVGDTASFNNINLLWGGRHNSNSSSLNLQIGINGGVNSSLTFDINDSGSVSGRFYTEEGYDSIAFAVGNTTDLAGLEALNAGLIRQTITDSKGVAREVYTFMQAGSGTFNTAFFIKGSDSDGAVTNSADLLVCVGSGGGSYNATTGRANANTAVSTLNITSFAGGASGRAAFDLSGIQFVASNASLNDTVLDFSGVETISLSKAALTLIEKKQRELQKWIGNFGATLSRLSSANSVVAIARENTHAAQSRIQDVDVAEESATLVRTQILQQSASAILAQANSQPALALNLLRGAAN